MPRPKSCSAMSGSASRLAFSKAGRAESSPQLPKATQTFRRSPRRLVRRTGEPAKRTANAASSNDNSSIKSGRDNKREFPAVLGGYPEKKSIEQIDKQNSPSGRKRAPGSVRV